MRGFAYFFMLLSLSGNLRLSFTQERARDNGDVYLINKLTHTVIRSTTPSATTTTAEPTTSQPFVDFNAVMEQCNASFSIPMSYITAFNQTAELPETVDKTGMCFVRCFYEKSGLINNWQLNANLIRQSMWPATGDSVEYCQKQGMHEMNSCVRAYYIAKCLTIRALVDARNPSPI